MKQESQNPTERGPRGEKSQTEDALRMPPTASSPAPTDQNPGRRSGRATSSSSMEESSRPPRNTDFCIDNILRPDFGRNHRVRDGGSAGGPRRRPDPAGPAAPQAPEGPQDPRPPLWPAWVYCTRYSDRPSSGPRSRRPKKVATPTREDKRPRTAFTAEQLQKLRGEFQSDRYLTEQRRRRLARDLGLNEAQIKIWFQNKRAKIKKASGARNSLAVQLMAEGLYNHSTNKDDSD